MSKVAMSANPNTQGYELSRLLTAAVVNEKFRKLLLSDPAKALAKGYDGEAFRLASEERQRILSIHTDNLAEFALQISGTRSTVTHQNNRYYHDRRAAFAIGMD